MDMPSVRGSKSALTGALALSLGLFSGCSFAFSHGPPPNHPDLDFFTCTESRLAPAVDVAWAALNLTGVVMVTGSDQARRTGSTIAAGLGWVALSGTSAVNGFRKAKACREAIRDLSARLEGRRGFEAAGPGGSRPVITP